MSIALVILLGYLLWLNNRGGYAEYSNYPLIVLFLGSIYMMFSLVGSFLDSHTPRRTDLIAVNKDRDPELFALIEEVAAYMGIVPPQRVYISSSASAAITIDANIASLIAPSHKRKSLEIGLGIINTMNYDELRAIIAHEMAHYSQRAMSFGSSLYIIGKSVQRLNESLHKSRNGVEGSYYILSNIVSSIVVKLFKQILDRYKDLSDELEFDADCVAAKYVGSRVLISALYKASFTYHNFNALMQTLSLLASSGRSVDNIYAAQRALNSVVLNGEWSYMLTSSSIALDRQSRIVRQRVKLLQNGNFVTNLTPNSNPAREMLLGYESECQAMSHHLYKELYSVEVTSENSLPIPIYKIWAKEILQQRDEK